LLYKFRKFHSPLSAQKRQPRWAARNHLSAVVKLKEFSSAGDADHEGDHFSVVESIVDADAPTF
jgi:hypothetical protein